MIEIHGGRTEEIPWHPPSYPEIDDRRNKAKGSEPTPEPLLTLSQ